MARHPKKKNKRKRKNGQSKDMKAKAKSTKGASRKSNKRTEIYEDTSVSKDTIHEDLQENTKALDEKVMRAQYDNVNKEIGKDTN